jgi:hypothetical protein
MGIRMTTSASALDAFLQRAARKIQENVLKALSKLGDESVVRIRNRSAKESWIDHTGNLRSSIGFAVYEQGSKYMESAFSQVLSGTDGSAKGKKIGEKLFLLLNEEQKNALMQYILEQGVCHGTVFNSCHTSFAAKKNPLTEIQEGELYLCLEHRTVRVRERMINLTSKEFDILALLIANPKRVFTYELITDLVWKEDCDFYSRKAIHNHISKLRKKLRFEPDLPNYIESVAGIGYKFEHL